MSEATRISLICRVRDRADNESWAEFIALYEPLLVGHVRRLGLGEHDTRDVIQEIYLKLLRALPGFAVDHSRGKFRTWLGQVARNAVIDWKRRRLIQARAEAGHNEALPKEMFEVPALDAEWEKQHRRRVLEFVLHKVKAETPAARWACFEQHVQQGRPSADVARELGLTANAVNVNASRILKRVRELCADHDEDLGHG